MVKCWFRQEKFQYQIERSPNGGSLVPHTLLNTPGLFFYWGEGGKKEGKEDMMEGED